MFKKVLKFIFSAAGAAIIGCGTGIAASSGNGADALGFLWEGLALRLPLSIGVAAIVFFILCLVIVLFIDRQEIGLSTVVNPVITGIFTELVFGAMPRFDNNFTVNIMLMVAGIVLIGVGAAFSAFSSSGKDPYTALVFALYYRLHANLALVRMSCDAVCFAGALLLGTGLKAGPFVAVLLIGVVLRTTYNLCQKIAFLR
jgi:uncharacterized membrane protein YczE